MKIWARVKLWVRRQRFAIKRGWAEYKLQATDMPVLVAKHLASTNKFNWEHEYMMQWKLETEHRIRDEQERMNNDGLDLEAIKHKHKD